MTNQFVHIPAEIKRLINLRTTKRPPDRAGYQVYRRDTRVGGWRLEAEGYSQKAEDAK